MADANDLTTLDNLKPWIFTSATIPTTEDALLTALITRVSTMLQKLIGRNIKATDYVESRDGYGPPQCRVFLVNTPINSVASLKLGSLSISPSPDGISPGYWIDADKKSITLIGYYIGRGQNAITISYNGGFAVVPGDLEQACIDACAWIYARRGRAGLSSQALPQGGQTNYSASLPADVMAVASRYNSVIIE